MSNLINYLRVAFQQARYMKQTVKSFCKSLFYVKMKYRTSDHNLPKNVLLHLFQLVNGLLDVLVDHISVGRCTWLLPEGRKCIASTLVSAIHEKDAVDGVSAYKFTVKMEQVLSPFIDVISLVSYFFSMVPLQFSFSLNEAISSRGYLKAMIREQPALWEVLYRLICGERNIHVIFNESFLNYPSECAILSQLLLQLLEHFDLGFQSIECMLYKEVGTTGAKSSCHESSFRSYRQKAEYLRDMLSSSHRVPVTVNEQKMKTSLPYLKLSNGHFELVLQAPVGIATCWIVQQGSTPPGYASLKVDPMQSLDLSSLLTKLPSLGGIPFTVVYTPQTNIIHNKLK